MTQADADIELEKFQNYWLAKTGPNATKLDWDRTWRNWVHTAAPRASPNTRSTTKERVNQGLTLAAQLRAREQLELTDGSQTDAS